MLDDAAGPAVHSTACMLHHSRTRANQPPEALAPHGVRKSLHKVHFHASRNGPDKASTFRECLPHAAREHHMLERCASGVRRRALAERPMHMHHTWTPRKWALSSAHCLPKSWTHLLADWLQASRTRSCSKSSHLGVEIVVAAVEAKQQSKDTCDDNMWATQCDAKRLQKVSPTHKHANAS